MAYQVIHECGRCGRRLKGDVYDPYCTNCGAYCNHNRDNDPRIEECEKCGVYDVVDDNGLCHICREKVK